MNRTPAKQAKTEKLKNLSQVSKMTLEEEAQAIVGIDGWHPWLFERIANGILCTGAVCPLITRGKNKGTPNYRKADQSTKMSVVVPFKSPQGEQQKKQQ